MKPKWSKNGDLLSKIRIFHEMDSGFICALSRMAGSSDAEVAKMTKASEVEFGHKERAFEKCPDGSVATWREKHMGKFRWLLFLVLLAILPCRAGLILREENDAFTGTDSEYTQGVEILVTGKPTFGTDGVRVRAYGFRNLIYTPSDIGIPENQPDERPWAGLSSFVIEDWKRTKTHSRRVDWQLGVLGEWSQSDHIQTWFHGLGFGRTPMGWDNQIPDEPFANASVEFYRPLVALGDKWKFDATGLYGGSLGTAFVNCEGGIMLRAGWNVPRDYTAAIVNPSAANSFSAHVFGSVKGRLVVHNATLGGSLWQDGPEQDLKPLVGDLAGGFALGLGKVFGTENDLRFSVSFVLRSEEFDGQEGSVDFGSISLCVARGF